jgi:predicted HTH transcriptional regulator
VETRRRLLRHWAAFANDYEGAGSGYIFCGVEEQNSPDGHSAPNVIGISSGASRKLRDRIFELSRSLVVPPIEPQFESVRLDGDKQVLVVWIASSSELHSFKKEVVIRLGDKVTTATVKQHSELAQRRAHLDWLDQPCPGATQDDVDFFALEEIAKGVRSTGGVLEFFQPGFRMFGSAPPLCSRIAGPSGDTVVPNRFAMLLIGKEPHHFLPGSVVASLAFKV